MTEPIVRLSLRPDAEVRESAGECILACPGIHVGVSLAAPGVRSTIQGLLDSPRSEAELSERLTPEGFDALPTLFYLLQLFDRNALLCRTLFAGAAPLVTVVPIASRYAFRPGAAEPDARYVLSSFAYLHRAPDGLALESPLSFARVRLQHPAAMSAIYALGDRPSTAAHLSAVTGLAACEASALVAMLAAAGFLSPADGQASQEESDPRLKGWEFHDLLFHSRSRLGRHANAFGGTYPFGDAVVSPPALKPAGSGPIVPLDKIDLQSTAATDPTLTGVLEGRRSTRTFGAEPVGLAQFGEFLYRTFRVKKHYSSEHGELLSRPFPSGGALYELELYLVVQQCTGLQPGLYHYRAGEHALAVVPAAEAPRAALLDQAWLTLNREGRPQVLIVLTARFQRLSFKYRSVVYALVLKHVGVVYQTMYLVATAMNLAACALGGGDSELFAEASGLDYLTESSVGEFVLGSRADLPGDPVATASGGLHDAVSL